MIPDISKLNYQNTLAGELVPEVNKQIDDDAKQFQLWVGNMKKGLDAQDKAVGPLAQLKDFAAATETIGKKAGELAKWKAAEKLWNDWYIDKKEAKSDYGQDNFEANHKEANMIKGKMQTLGYAHLKRGEPWLAKKALEATASRDEREKTFKKLAAMWPAVRASAAKTWDIKLPDGRSMTLEQATDIDDMKYIMGRIQLAFLTQAVGEDGMNNPKLIRKYMFKSMSTSDEAYYAKRTADMAKTVDENATNERNQTLGDDIIARGMPAVLDHFTQFAGVYSGGQDVNIDHPGMKKRVFGTIADLVTNGYIPIEHAEPLLYEKFAAHDGSIQSAYITTDPRRKPYWKEAEVLAKAIDAKKRKDTQEKTQNFQSDMDGYDVEIQEKIKEKGSNLTEPELTAARRVSVERFGKVTPYLQNLMTQGEEDDNEIYQRLVRRWIDGEDIDMTMAAGIDDPTLLMQVKNNLVDKSIASPISSSLKGQMTSIVNGFAVERSGDTGIKGGSQRTAIEQQGLPALIAEYRKVKGANPGFSEEQALGEAAATIKKKIDEGSYDKWSFKSVYTDKQTVYQTAARTLINNRSAYTTQLIPGLEKEAEQFYEFLESPELFQAKGGNLNTILAPYKSIRRVSGNNINARTLAHNQANVWAALNGKKTYNPAPTLLEANLEKQPSEVTALLDKKNNGNGTVRAFSKVDNLVGLVETMRRPETLTNGGVNAIQTGSGIRDSSNVYDKPNDATTIGELLERDVAGIGSHLMTKSRIKEILPLTGLSKDDLWTEENEKIFYIMGVLDRLQDQNAYCGVLNSWRALGINPVKLSDDFNIDFSDPKYTTKGCVKALSK